MKPQHAIILWLAFCLPLALAVGVPGAEPAEPPATPTPQVAKSDSGTLKGDASLLYIKGREKVLDGKFDEAIPLLEKALKADPDSTFLSYQLGELYLRVANYEKAETLTKKAVEGDPNNVEYRATLGGIYASTKRYAEAKEQYIKIMELEPENQKAPLLIGILEAESGQLEQGALTLSKAIEANSENYMALFYRAKIFIELEQVKKAKVDLDRALTLRPNFVEAGTVLGMLQERLGETDEAIATYNRIQGAGRFKKRLAQLYLQKNEFDKALEELLEYEKVEPDDYSARVKIGLIYFEVKKYDLAIERFQAILKEQPNADNVRFYLGAVYEEQKHPDKAISEYKKVTKESTFYKEAMLHVGFILKEAERTSEGIEFSRKVLVKNQDIVEFYDMHASFFEQGKDYKKALSVLGDGLKKFPTDEKLLYFEGALYDKMGERKHGIENMKKILRANENNAHALNFLAYTYAEMGENLEEAERLAQKAITLRPNDGYIEDSLGWVLFKEGKVDVAIQTLEKAITLQPEEPIIYEHLGDVYLHQKDYAKAVTTYKKAMALSTKKDRDMAKKIESKLAALQKEKRIPSAEEN